MFIAHYVYIKENTEGGDDMAVRRECRQCLFADLCGSDGVCDGFVLVDELDDDPDGRTADLLKEAEFDEFMKAWRTYVGEYE